MRLLLPLDVSQPYEGQLIDLEELLPLKGAQVTLLYVLQNSGYDNVLSVLGKSPVDCEAVMQEHARKILSAVSDQLKQYSATVTTRILSGKPANVIREIAKEEAPDLIVLGPAQHASKQSFLLGSTASDVVRYAPGAVFILRPNKGRKKCKRVLIAVDGSPQALKALKHFVRHFGPLSRQIEIYLLSVVSIVSIWKFISPAEFVASIEDNLNMVAETILADAQKALAEEELSASELIIRTGDPAREIIKTAEDTDSDMIVLGAHGKTNVEEFLLGSVSNKLSLHATRPTLIVK